MYKKIVEIFHKVISSKKFPIYALIFLMCLGFFLRAYNFHDWLHFGKDQSRDAFANQAVALGESPWPLLGADMGNTSYRIGPLYFYFQIISAKIFGQDPAALAYPDLLFSILSIPLLYYFLRRYFSSNLALTLTGIYVISYFDIIYSRFAWNPNPIPFFVILFMLSLYEFVVTKEKTRWLWVLAFGTSAGASMQLHATVMILIPATLVFVFGFLLFKNHTVWKKIIIVLGIIIILSIPQIIGEVSGGFKNFKIFTSSLTEQSKEDESSELLYKTGLNLACHAQANFHIISSLGDKYDCNYVTILKNGPKKMSTFEYGTSILLILVSFIFAIFGYYKVLKISLKDNDEKRRYFMALVLLYSVLFFPLLIPAIDGASHRYFISIIFVPYIFLGILLENIFQKKQIIYCLVAILIVSFLVFANLFSVFREAKNLQDKKRGTVEFAVLGELEDMVDYMRNNADGKNKAMLDGGSKYLPRYALALIYVSTERKFDLKRVNSREDILAGDVVFYIGSAAEGILPKSINNLDIEKYQQFGQIGIYKLKN